MVSSLRARRRCAWRSSCTWPLQTGAILSFLHALVSNGARIGADMDAAHGPDCDEHCRVACRAFCVPANTDALLRMQGRGLAGEALVAQTAPPCEHESAAHAGARLRRGPRAGAGGQGRCSQGGRRALCSPAGPRGPPGQPAAPVRPCVRLRADCREVKRGRRRTLTGCSSDGGE